MRWYVPSWNGDIRFESIDEGQTLLTVIKPTRGELDRIIVLERIFFANEWITKGLWDPQRADSIQECVVKAPLLEVGKHVVDSYVQGEAALTAIRFENEEVRVVEAGKGFFERLKRAFRIENTRVVDESSDLRVDVLVEVNKRRDREKAEQAAREESESRERERRAEAERKAEATRKAEREERERLEAQRRAEAERVEAKRKAEREQEERAVAKRREEHKAAGRVWFVSISDGQTEGPMTSESLREMFAAKKINPKTLVSHYDWSKWYSLDQVKEFDDLMPKPKVAATVKKPTSCCPTCLRGPMSPEKEVLFAFLSDDEKAQWAEDHSIVVTGGMTGHRYLLSHRNGIWAARHTKICHDLDDDVTLHFHDNTVPPEEEVLAAKLILEHRENWLRHQATFFGPTKILFDNPFGDGSDGTRSASAMWSFGDSMMDAFGIPKPVERHGCIIGEPAEGDYVGPPTVVFDPSKIA